MNGIFEVLKNQSLHKLAIIFKSVRLARALKKAVLPESSPQKSVRRARKPVFSKRPPCKTTPGYCMILGGSQHITLPCAIIAGYGYENEVTVTFKQINSYPKAHSKK